jgi:hypothetical protein
MMKKNVIKQSAVVFILFCNFVINSAPAAAFTANKVWFEFKKNGIYRVYVNYTVPELKEFRESYVDFRSKKKAEKYYFDLVRGANFYQPHAKDREFKNQDLIPVAW